MLRLLIASFSLLSFCLCGQVRIPGPGGSAPVTGAPPAFVNCAAGDTGGGAATSAATSATSLTAGNAVYCAAFFQNGCGSVTLSISDTAANAYTAIGTRQDEAGSLCSQAFYAKNVAGNASNVYTVAASNNASDLSISCLQMNGASTTAPLNTSSQTNAGGATVNTLAAASLDAAANSLMVVGVSDYAITRTWTADTGYTANSACISTLAHTAIEYKQFTSSAASQTPSMTVSGGATFMINLAANFQ